MRNSKDKLVRGNNAIKVMPKGGGGGIIVKTNLLTTIQMSACLPHYFIN